MQYLFSFGCIKVFSSG